MLKKLYFVETEDTPEIILDKETETFEITGRSMPENVNDLYTPIIDWFNNYFKEPLNETVLKINLEYFNSASGKKIVSLLMILENFVEKKCNIKVVWYYKRNDFTMQKKGVDLLSIFKIPFEIKSL
jgi:hypothetical protein